jgi:hypothetical protein
MSQTQTSTNRIIRYIVNHQVSLGILLAAYGAFYLASVIMGGWTVFDWGKDVFTFPHSAVHAFMPRSFISPFFFVSSLPTLLIGAALLCDSCIDAIRFGLTVESQYAAVLLVVFGFAYLVVGAWPLQMVIDMPWVWQKQIMSYSSFFAWMLYLLGIIVFVVGSVSLWAHSKKYHRGQTEPF